MPPLESSIFTQIKYKGINLKKIIYLVLSIMLFSTALVSADFRTIMVDGEVSDWHGATPLVNDPEGDQTGSPEEDIKAVYYSNDAHNIYFWMELYHDVPLPVAAESSNFGPDYVYIFFLDTAPGTGDPAYGGADYAVEYSVTGTFNVIVRAASSDPSTMTKTCLFKWNETGGYWFPDYECTGVEGNSGGPNIEVSLAWSCIGGAKCFNTMFMAKSGAPNTDYAPDMKNGLPVTIRVCPCMPVAGELLPGTWRTPSIPQLLITLIVSSAAIIAYVSKDKARYIST